MKTMRFGVSVDEKLLENFDRFVAESGYPTRSEALKNLMRDAVHQSESVKGNNVAGSVAFSYNHHRADVVEKLHDAQHDFCDEIVCSQHVHLTHDDCIETLVVRGAATAIKDLLRRLREIKGLHNVSLAVVWMKH